MPILGSTATTVSNSTINVKDYGALGNYPTNDDATAIQTAINVLKAKGGGWTLHFPPGLYKIGSALDFSGLSDCRITGTGGRSQANPATMLIYTPGGSASALNLHDCNGIIWDGVSVWANPVTFSGVLMDFDSTSAGLATEHDIFGNRVQNCQIRAVSGSSAILVSMATNIECTFDNVTFMEAGASGTQVRMINNSAPGHWSNANSFRSCSFLGMRQYSILNPAHQVTLFDCTFEPSQSGVPAPIAYTALGNEPASGLTLIGCGFWDNTATTGAWITSTVATDSFAIVGGFMTCGASGISLSNHTGLSIQGMRFGTAGSPTPNVFDPASVIHNGSMLGCNVVSPVVDNHASVFS